jgi:hypothetical protein
MSEIPYVLYESIPEMLNTYMAECIKNEPIYHQPALEMFMKMVLKHLKLTNNVNKAEIARVAQILIYRQLMEIGRS